jgi:hypothetical protein
MGEGRGQQRSKNTNEGADWGESHDSPKADGSPGQKPAREMFRLPTSANNPVCNHHLPFDGGRVHEEIRTEPPHQPHNQFGV